VLINSEDQVVLVSWSACNSNTLP